MLLLMRAIVKVAAAPRIFVDQIIEIACLKHERLCTRGFRNALDVLCLRERDVFCESKGITSRVETPMLLPHARRLSYAHRVSSLFERVS